MHTKILFLREKKFIFPLKIRYTFRVRYFHVMRLLPCVKRNCFVVFFSQDPDVSKHDIFAYLTSWYEELRERMTLCKFSDQKGTWF